MPSLKQQRRAYYRKYHVENKIDKLKRAEYNQRYYVRNADKIKADARARYQRSPNTKKAASRALYKVSPHKKKAASHAYYINNHSASLQSYRKYHCCHKKKICAFKKDRYVLAHPKPTVKELYLKGIQANLLINFEARCQLINCFKRIHPCPTRQISRGFGRTACRLAARNLLNKALQLRKRHAGALLRSVRHIKSMQIKQRGDFGKGCHSRSTEAYFYDSAYQ